MSIAEEIQRLHDLHKSGALSDDEFAAAKARLLSQESHRPREDDINRFRRSRDDRWLGGVCGGLGRISGIDAWIWRLLLVLLVLTFGFGLAIYILLWIFVPEEELIGK
ncbi:MAG: PspC domain-containing protein [Duganella sp.]